ncbi:hypothetical protein [Pseudomonas sp. UMAB-40]|uniref:hypothetical protein n=1 Tax=Pseudomonas sp. UMAB-40 TaxID=1365407 RepID=UPI001C59D1F7|nr:hypothetical protein [Pseudomonas sp. UMAB-40]
MKISQLVDQFLADLPIGCVLTEEQITRHLRDAVRQYCGYARLTSAQSLDTVHSDLYTPGDSPTAVDVDLTHSELAIIRPLWLLYIENENALALEASRSQGADPFGRNSSEVKQSILDYEGSLPRLTFVYEVRSI